MIISFTKQQYFLHIYMQSKTVKHINYDVMIVLPQGWNYIASVFCLFVCLFVCLLLFFFGGRWGALCFWNQ
jgi:hypothetical protein